MSDIQQVQPLTAASASCVYSGRTGALAQQPNNVCDVCILPHTGLHSDDR